MRIDVEYISKKPSKEGPFKHYGKFVCYPTSERENNLLAGFTEDVWLRAESDDFSVSFAPSDKLLAYWINGNSTSTVKELIDESIERIEHGFKQNSLEIEKKSI